MQKNILGKYHVYVCVIAYTFMTSKTCLVLVPIIGTMEGIIIYSVLIKHSWSNIRILLMVVSDNNDDLIDFMSINYRIRGSFKFVHPLGD